MNPLAQPIYDGKRQRLSGFIRTSANPQRNLWHDTAMPTPGNPYVEVAVIPGSIEMPPITILSVKGFPGVGTGDPRRMTGLRTL